MTLLPGAWLLAVKDGLDCVDRTLVLRTSDVLFMFAAEANTFDLGAPRSDALICLLARCQVQP